MSRHFTFDLEDVLVGEPLPGNIYVFIQNRFILLRAKDDVIDRATFERLDLKKAQTLFVLEQDQKAFEEWSQRRKQMAAETQAYSPETQAIQVLKSEARESLIDLFQTSVSPKFKKGFLESKKIVHEVMKIPFALKSLAEIQNFSRSASDHSLNVSVLSVYLAQQMGYTHKGILQNIGAGALLHDIGKILIKTDENDPPELTAAAMLDHPLLGADYLGKDPDVSNEVKMIVAQHHELHDGSGYPRKLKGNQIYDLARIVSICNMFDELVSNAKGSLRERQVHAIHQLDRVLYRQFDQTKLFKAIKIFQLGV